MNRDRLSPKDPRHLPLYLEYQEFHSFLRHYERYYGQEIDLRLVRCKMEELAKVWSKTMSRHTRWTCGQTHILTLWRLLRDLKALIARIFQGAADGVNYPTVRERFAAMKPEIFDILRAVSRVFEREIAQE